ncbi:MAG TPA: SPFH/Band 7/PHB domain protein, partial [Acidimicrobiia bacterium]|nr:SPFH/Band 7/PHB domain protein [Acidimicrobiia bacterium]
ARVLRAEGLKLSQVLEAEGQAEAIKRVADADRYKRETVAEGEGRAIERVFAAIHTGNPSPDLIAIRYLEALQGIANGQATKIFLPLDTAGVMGSVAAVSELWKEAKPG